MPLVQRMIMLVERESPAQNAPLGFPVQIIVPLGSLLKGQYKLFRRKEDTNTVNWALAKAAEATMRAAVYFMLTVYSRVQGERLCCFISRVMLRTNVCVV